MIMNLITILALIVAVISLYVMRVQLKKSIEANGLAIEALKETKAANDFDYEQNRKVFFTQKLRDLFIFAVESEQLLEDFYHKGLKNPNIKCKPRLDDFLKKSYRLKSYPNYVMIISEYREDNELEKTVVEIRTSLVETRREFRKSIDSDIDENHVKKFKETVSDIREKLILLEDGFFKENTHGKPS